MKASSFLACPSRWISLCALSVMGCQLIFGDYKTQPGEPGIGSSCDASGAERCDGATLEICEGHTWIEKEQCPTSQQCDASRSECLACVPGAVECLASELQRCGSDGESWSATERCVSSIQCNAKTGKCDPCEADEAVCEGQYLKLCNADHTAWNLIDCEDPNLCNSGTRDCRPCKKGEYQCEGASLKLCNADQEWEVIEGCASEALCKLTAAQQAEPGDDGVRRCIAPGCPEAGVYRCDPDNPVQPQSCPSSLLGWENTGTSCYTADLCDPTTGRCKNGCKPGNYRCNGAGLEKCNLQGTDWTPVATCTSAAQCDAQAKDCHDCSDGEKSCNGAQLRVCKNREWVQLGVCSSDELCQSSLALNKCTPPGCNSAGAYQCSGNILQTCPTSQVAWTQAEVCETAGLCDAAKKVCLVPVCSKAGEFRCTGKVLEACSADRASWVPVKTCASTEICSVAEGTCLNGCPDALTQCNGKTIEECYVDDSLQPKWRTTDTQCATAALCVNGACKQPACAVNEYRCTGQQLEVCNADRTGFKLEKTCDAGTTCDAGYHQCDVCVADNFVCDGSTLKRCEGSGARLDVKAEDCVRCEVSPDKKSGSCYVCNMNDTQCSGASQIQSCTNGGLAWGTPSDCSDGMGHNYGCEKNTSAVRKDQCAKCPVAGQLECTSDGKGLRQCMSPDRSGWSSTCDGCGSCPYGCLDNASGPDACKTACEPNQTKCETVNGGTSTTGKNTCAADGSAWLGAKQKCAGDANLALCANGDFSTTQKVACPQDKPVCVDAAGGCVACLPSSATCVTGGRQQCQNDYTLKFTPCPCFDSECVECLANGDCSASAPICDTTTHHCVPDEQPDAGAGAAGSPATGG